MCNSSVIWEYHRSEIYTSTHLVVYLGGYCCIEKFFFENFEVEPKFICAKFQFFF